MTLAQIMMTQLVKRVENSFYAFKKSLNRFRFSTERIITETVQQPVGQIGQQAVGQMPAQFATIP